MAALSSRYTYEGTEVTETSITRVGGATDQTGQAQSRKVTTTANAQWLRPFLAESYAVWNPTAGANVDVTVYGTINAGALPNNDDIWMDVEYLTLNTGVPSPPAVDGSSVTGIKSGGGALVTAALTTTQANDIIVVVSSVEGNGVTTPDVTSVTGGGLTFTRRSHALSGAPGGVGPIVEVWWAVAASPLAAIAFTVNYGATYDDAAAIAFGVKGCNTASPWDSNGSLPNFWQGSAATPTFTGVSTNSGNELLLMALGTNGNTTSFTEAAGFTQIGNVLNGGGTLFAWAHVSGNAIAAAQSSATITAGTSIGSYGAGSVNSLVGLAGVASPLGKIVNTTKSNVLATPAAVASDGSGWNGGGSGAGWSPFKLTTTLSSPQPGLAGYINVRPRVAKPSTTFYIDPTVTLTPAGGGTSNVATAYTSSRYAYEGTETTEISITRVNGAADPTGQKQSRKIVTSANSQWLRPFKAEPYAVWNNVTGSNVTVTVYGTVNAGALPNNDDIWMDVEYLTMSSQLATYDPTRIFGSIALSNGNLTITHTAAAVSGVCATVFLTTGKYYFETQTTMAASTQCIGLLMSTGATSDGPTVTTTVVVAAGTGSSNIYVNSANSGKNLGNAATGDTFSFAVDLTNHLIWARRNGGNWNADATANPATGVGGLTFTAASYAPYVQIQNSSSGEVLTSNFGATSYAFTPPSGFGNWIAPPAPLGKIVNTTKSNVLATPAAVASDGSGWNGGGSGAGWSPFKLTTTLNSPAPGVAGYIHTRVRAAKPSTTFYINPQITVAPYVPSSEVAAFLARTSGLDATHTNAYTALIDGLVADGIWAKLDMLHVYATQDSTTALLNLVSTSYNGIASGSPTFTTDRGFTGVQGSPTTVYIDTQFNASTAISPKFIRDSAHLSVWNLTNTTTSDYVVGVSGTPYVGLLPKYLDGNAYCYVNGSQVGGVVNSDPRGMTLANRSSSSTVQLYKNGSSIFTTSSNSSTGLPILSIHALGYQDAASAHIGQAWQEAMVGIGSSLTVTDVTNFYNRLRTYMAVVGVP